LPQLPHVDNFIKKHAEEFHNLKVQHIRGVGPSLLFQDKKNVTVEQVSIDGWNTDTIYEYLTVKLER